jgi:hypothetical protein
MTCGSEVYEYPNGEDQEWVRRDMARDIRLLKALQLATEDQLAAVIADNAELRTCLQYVSERAGIQHETLVQYDHRLIVLETRQNARAALSERITQTLQQIREETP